MKLLLDQNLSPRLVRQLSDLYPDSIHVAFERDWSMLSSLGEQRFSWGIS
ncbi:MAG: hypothetical protein GY762_23610 [Proteobacteria bacterium]|nr:hypothetical protein [Pseudomonadota bacterium]